MQSNTLRAGAAQTDISPQDSQFLYGYPYVERYSTGIHDPLLSSSLYLAAAESEVLFIANDIIFIDKDTCRRVREGIAAATSLASEAIMVTATHTHSGPITVDNFLCAVFDPVIPQRDRKYVDYLVERMIASGIAAFRAARPARAGFAIADDTGVGTNRHDPNGPANHQVPVMLVKDSTEDQPIACMLVCSMHPTVLHEDSTLVSADFPGQARIYLQEQVLGADCPVLHHTGPAGNQSPRHVTRGNTFEEARRLGEILGRAVEKSIGAMAFRDDLPVAVTHAFLPDPPRRELPSPEEARATLEERTQRLEELRKSGAPKEEIRTAECDWFGADRTAGLAPMAAEGRLENAYQASLPLELQIIKVGDWHFAAWPGEIFVEYALAVKEASPHTFVIAYANGTTAGYIVTAEAARKGCYESFNALFCPEVGPLLVQETLQRV